MLSFLLQTTITGQTFTNYGFSVNCGCSLQNAINTVDDEGNNVLAFQCSKTTAVVVIYRVNVIQFTKNIVSSSSFYASLRKSYSSLGAVTNTTLGGKEAVEVVENLMINGNRVKQVSISTLHRNNSITLVLVTNSSEYSSLVKEFKGQFKLL